MNIFTLGNGFVSSHLPYPKILDRLIADQQSIRLLLMRYRPDVIVNTLGWGGVKNIDDCELNKERTLLSNTIIPILLAIECEKLDIHLVNISSGCIFSGESINLDYDVKDHGWFEGDFANPQSFYSKTKYACDLAIENLSKTTLLRIRMPISNKNSPRNLINKLRCYNKIIDIKNSVTFVDDLCRCIEWVIYNKKYGIFNVTNSEPLTAVDIMNEYKKYVPEHKFEVISEGELDNLTIAKRSNCLLNSNKLKKSGFIMSNSKEALEKCMKEYIKNI